MLSLAQLSPSLFHFILNLYSIASFSIYIFLLNNFIFFIFVLCWRLQCQHSCQYFVLTLILFLISFSVTSFSTSIFLRCNVNHLPSIGKDLNAKNDRYRNYLVSGAVGVRGCCVYSTHVLHCTVLYTDCDCTVVLWSARALTTIDVAHPIRDQLARALTNQEPQNLGQTQDAGHRNSSNYYIDWIR